MITYYYYDFLINISIYIYTHYYTLLLLIYRDIPRSVPCSPAQLPERLGWDDPLRRMSKRAPLGHQRRCSFEGFGTHHLVQPPGGAQVHPCARYLVTRLL